MKFAFRLPSQMPVSRICVSPATERRFSIELQGVKRDLENVVEVADV